MSKKYFLLILIFLLGFLLRFYQVGQIPPGLNRDEASIGYTAYSLIKSGRDEYGVNWPVSFKSFGDWKLPFYIYLSIPFISAFGLNDVAVRLPSVLSGALTVFTAYFLAKELFKSSLKIPLLSAFFFALSPWSIHLSRNASESTVAVFFTSIGLLFWLRSRCRKIYLILGTIFMAVPLYTYHGNHIFSLLFFIGLAVFFWRRYKPSTVYLLPIAVFAVLALFIYSRTLFVADKTKISGLLSVGDPSLVYEKVTIDRLEHGQSGAVGILLHNKIIFTAITVAQNYIRGFSPEFLFITGGGNTQHNIPDFGNLYLWAAPFLFFGVSYLFFVKNDSKFLLFWWLLIAPLAASITKDAPHSNRMAAVLPVLDIITALGFIKGQNILLGYKKKKIAALSVMILILLFIFNFSIWTDDYFIHFPVKRASLWGEGYTKLVTTLAKNNNFEAKEIIMSRPEYSPYIYFLFYNRIDPSHFQSAAVRYPVTDEGFQHVAKFDNYSFRQVDWSDDLMIPDRLYIDWSSQVPAAATNSATLITNSRLLDLAKNRKDISDLRPGDFVISRKVGDIKLQNGESIFTLIKTVKQL